jgi:phosphoglycolate phosphatase-like HAD superfamily hydrolase
MKTNLPLAAQSAAFEAFWEHHRMRLGWSIMAIPAFMHHSLADTWQAVAHHMLSWTELTTEARQTIEWCLERGEPSFEHTALYPEFADLFSEAEKLTAMQHIAEARRALNRMSTAGAYSFAD